MAPVASRRFFSRPHFCGSKTTRIETSRRSVQFSARELRCEIISCIFGWCPYQNKPRLSWSLHISIAMPSGTAASSFGSWLQNQMPSPETHANIFGSLHCQYVYPSCNAHIIRSVEGNEHFTLVQSHVANTHLANHLFWRRHWTEVCGKGWEGPTKAKYCCIVFQVKM